MNAQDDRPDAPEERDKPDTGPIKPPTREGDDTPAQDSDTRRDTGEIKPPTE
ncbi:MAG: hypothetical protein JO360_18970 [Acidobacteria bacterium]|nr:hypothetical protein [Acidobacteriota bacterium]